MEARMKLIIYLLFALEGLSIAKVTGIKKLEWIDPYGRQPVLYTTWESKNVPSGVETKIANIYSTNKIERQNVVDVVVNAEIYPSLQQEISIFTQDLETAGHSVQVDTIRGMSHTQLRSHLAGIAELEGAIFIGETPVAWFETNGFGNWEEFPHDLFFCDLDGTYIDADEDGIFDNHTGNTAPEIWLGRIYARNLTWDNEITLLKKYFAKNHRYRTDSLTLPQRALTFIDDDWSYWTTCGLEQIYSTVVVVNDDYQTTAANYRSQFSQGYEWLHLCSHSSPWGHTFLYPGSVYRGTVFNYEIYYLAPQALFYNLFACSGTRFIEENNSAGWYLFGDEYGLLVIGSTKTGGMLGFEDFYTPLGQQNISIGEAFKQWFTLWGEMDWDWFYGLNIMGDPTLKPENQSYCKTGQKESRVPKLISDWDPPEIIASDPESDGFPEISANADEAIWVVWESGRSPANGRSDIYSARYSAGGWSSGMEVGPFYYWDYGPTIAARGGVPVAVWAGWEDQYGNYQYDLFYSSYNGSWSSRQPVHGLDPASDMNPSLAEDNASNLWVCWESRRNVSIDIFASYFNGSAWSAPQQATSDAADEVSPEILVDNDGTLWIFFCRRTMDKAEICGCYYTGSQWLPTAVISGTQKMAYHPSAAVDAAGRIWVTWHAHDAGNPEIFSNYYNGSQWSSPQQVTSNSSNDLFPDITADTSGTIWLVYQGRVGTDWDVFSMRLSGTTWCDMDTVAGLAGPDINPRIACSNTNELWVCWQGYVNGNWEILCTHKAATAITETTKTKPITGQFLAFPSVSARSVSIRTPQPCQRITIYDAAGKLVSELTSDAMGSTCWATDGVPAGSYFLRITNLVPEPYFKVILVK
jgi:hypothetical protein